jgi:hypothetical protein
VSNVPGTFAYSPSVGTALSVGSQTLSVTFTPTDTTDYTTATVTTTLTVNKAVPTISWAAPAAITYGAPLSATQLNATSNVPGIFVYSPTAGTVLSAGSQTLSVSFTPADTINYTTAIATTSIAVSVATPVLSFAPIAGQTYGATPFVVSANSVSSGAVTYAVASGPATIAGNVVTLTGVGTVVLNASQTANGNYTAGMATTSFVVVAPFTLASGSGAGTSGGSATVAAGGAASFSFTLTPGSGATLLHGVTFSATGLPQGATANFSPATISAGSGATSITLTVQTSATQAARNKFPFSGSSLAPIALGCLFLPLVGRKSGGLSRLMMLVATVLSLGVALGLSGCAGNGNQHPAQNYTVVVTAKDVSTGVQSSTNIALTVQ